MARGGRRVGAGRKPGPRTKAVVLGMDGARLPGGTATPAAADASPSADPLTIPPLGLPPAQQGFWTSYAPHAIEQQTLIAATVIGFRELCEQWALKEEIALKLAALGATTFEADRLLKHYEKLAQRVDALLARFKLTSFGKPAGAGAGDKKKTAANPWAQVAK